MYITKKIREDIFKDNGTSEKDTGSTEGQIALFTTKINHLTNHLKENKKDDNILRNDAHNNVKKHDFNKDETIQLLKSIMESYLQESGAKT